MFKIIQITYPNISESELKEPELKQKIENSAPSGSTTLLLGVDTVDALNKLTKEFEI